MHTCTQTCSKFKISYISNKASAFKQNICPFSSTSLREKWKRACYIFLWKWNISFTFIHSLIHYPINKHLLSGKDVNKTQPQSSGRLQSTGKSTQFFKIAEVKTKCYEFKAKEGISGWKKLALTYKSSDGLARARSHLKSTPNNIKK